MRYPEETARYLNDYVTVHRYAKDFFVYAMTGSEDIAYPAMQRQLDAMRKTDAFVFGEPGTGANISFAVLNGGVHDYEYYRNYIYSILLDFAGFLSVKRWGANKAQADVMMSFNIAAFCFCHTRAIITHS